MSRHIRRVQLPASLTRPGSSHLRPVSTKDPGKQKRSRCTQNPILRSAAEVSSDQTYSEADDFELDVAG